MFDAITFLNQIPKPVMILLVLWSLVWKGIALWKSSRNNQKYWFVVMLFVNTLGILEIVYITSFQKKLKQK